MSECVCGGKGFYIQIWHVAIATGPTTRRGDFCIMHRRFVIPCHVCNLATYSRWFAKHQEELDGLAPCVVGQETAVAVS